MQEANGSDSLTIETTETAETTIEWEVKQPNETGATTDEATAQQAGETTKVQQPTTLVKQGATAETTENETPVTPPLKQPSATNATANKETIVLLERDDRYLKQRCRQCYKRKNTQEDPTTPAENYRIFKNALELRGFKVIPQPKEGKPHNVEIFKPANSN